MIGGKDIKPVAYQIIFSVGDLQEIMTVSLAELHRSSGKQIRPVFPERKNCAVCRFDVK